MSKMARCARNHEAAETTTYEERLAKALTESRRDFSTGRFYTNKEEMLAAVAEKRAKNGIDFSYLVK